MQDFGKLDVYKKAIGYGVAIYKFSAQWPDNEKYGLVSQIRRAVCSITLNISEGAGCSSNKEFAQFIGYAYRSTNEVLSCLELAKELKIITEATAVNELINQGIEISRMLYSFFKKLGGKSFTYNL